MPGKCEEVREQLSAWLDGELAEEERARVAAHVDSCAACRREADQFVALNAALGHLAAPMPPGLAARVLARVQPPRRRRWWQDLALAASLVIGLIAGGTLARDFYPPSANGTGPEIAALEDFHDFPQGSLGAIFVSYQSEEGNGT
jgi:anti-sigma factor (TIGR02949 family)